MKKEDRLKKGPEILLNYTELSHIFQFARNQQQVSLRSKKRRQATQKAVWRAQLTFSCNGSSKIRLNTLTYGH